MENLENLDLSPLEAEGKGSIWRGARQIVAEGGGLPPAPDLATLPPSQNSNPPSMVPVPAGIPGASFPNEQLFRPQPLHQASATSSWQGLDQYIAQGRHLAATSPYNPQTPPPPRAPTFQQQLPHSSVPRASAVTPHPCCGAPGCSIHCAANVTGGSPTVYAEGKPVHKVMDTDTCGHPRVQGDTRVLVIR